MFPLYMRVFWLISSLENSHLRTGFNWFWATVLWRACFPFYKSCAKAIFASKYSVQERWTISVWRGPQTGTGKLCWCTGNSITDSDGLATSRLSPVYFSPEPSICYTCKCYLFRIPTCKCYLLRIPTSLGKVNGRGPTPLPSWFERLVDITVERISRWRAVFLCTFGVLLKIPF